MKKARFLRQFFIGALLCADLAALILSFEAAYWTRFEFPLFLEHFPALKGIPDIATYHQALWAVLPVWIIVMTQLGFYRETLTSAYDEFILVLKGIVLSTLVTMAMTFAYRGSDYSRLAIGLWALYSATLVFVMREFTKALFSQLLTLLAGSRHVMVVGRGPAVDALRQNAKRERLVQVHFRDRLPTTEAMRAASQNPGISEVILIQGGVSNPDLLEAARLCESLSLDCQVVPDLFEMRRGQIILDGFLGLPTFHIKPLSLHSSNYLLKRAFDILVSLTVLTVLFLPLMIVMFLICMDSPGPVLFTQDRMGLRGRKFSVYKFRTMVSDADALLEKIKHLSDRTGPVFKMKNDPRITSVGRWLRALSIDEIPQLINVLRGEMSLVGPRPQVLWEAAAYDDHAKKRLRVLPGITGLWQVSGRASLSYEQMIDLDVFYVENWSLGLDLKIILRTLPAVFAKEGAY